jgi:MFS family permease
VTIKAKNYEWLYWGNFIVALGNGTVEAYINPVVATIFSKQKTKWLNILHAGWPGGMVLGGILSIALGAADFGGWQLKVLLLLIPTAIYFVMLIPEKFPVNERVAAGVSYRDMLREVGALGVFVIGWMMFAELIRVFAEPIKGLVGTAPTPVTWGAAAAGAVAAIFGLAVRSLGRPMFIFLLVVMIPLATTELGVDSWVTDLMGPAMGKLAPWLIVYTSVIMMLLRFCAGGIIHRLSPLGTLAASAALAALGLLALSAANTSGMILLAATLYGIGKTFFWPTTLGVVAEQFPKGGAFTLNGISGVGMLGVGVLGAMLLGNIQDHATDKELARQDPALHGRVTVEKPGLLGAYHAVDPQKLESLPEAERKAVTAAQDGSKKVALKQVAILPAAMLLGYFALIGYFASRGGYRPVDLGADAAPTAKG